MWNQFLLWGCYFQAEDPDKLFHFDQSYLLYKLKEMKM